jgi:hypothetical protein
MRTSYGVRVGGVSGTEVVWAATRGAANRLRRVLRAYIARGEWSGVQTLRALMGFAAQARYVRTEKIVSEFLSNRKQGES